MSAIPSCDYAACTTVALYPDDGWAFCWTHYEQHRADLHAEPWPKLAAVDLRSLFAPRHGTGSAARQHYRRGEKPCQLCLDASRREKAPHNPDRRRGNWYRVAS